MIGAGAAGIALTVELVRLGNRVLLLEGGGVTFEESSQEPYVSDAATLPHRGLHSGRFRVLGGTTTRWGGQILELDDHDFSEREWVPGSGWPFPKSELTESYANALRVEGLGLSELNDDAVWETLGTHAPAFEKLESYLSRWCPEPDFRRLHHDVLAGPSVQVWLHANATSLVLEGDKVTGVRACTMSGTGFTFEAQRFVFCLGAIECNRFFLQPSPSSRPWNRSGLLGEHFQDHIDCNVGVLHPISLPALKDRFDGIFLGGFKYQPKIKLNTSKQRDCRVLNVAATLAYDSATSARLALVRTNLKHLLRRRFRNVDPSAFLSVMDVGPSLIRQTHRYLRHRRSYQPDDAQISLRIHCEQEPHSQSRISLSDETDSLGMFRTRLDWRISPMELRSIRCMTSTVKESLRGFAEIFSDFDLEDDQELISKCEDSFHHMGGMRMDASPNCGIVDPQLKLHGVSNTWICSSATFPTSGFSNPTHTLLALAVRLAAHLSQDSA